MRVFLAGFRRDIAATMIRSDMATLTMVLLLGAWLAGRGPWEARAVLWGAALLVSAAMFLPSATLTEIVGADRVEMMYRSADRLPWELSTIAHFGAFLLLSCVLWSFRPEWRGWRVVAVLAVLAIAGELMQGLGKDRTPKISDAAVNLMGAATGVMLGALVTAMRRRASGKTLAAFPPDPPE